MKIKLTIDEIEIGQTVAITVDGIRYLEIDDPDPGEEKPEEEEEKKIWAIGKTGTN